MDKRFWICGLVVSVAALMLDFLVHGVALRADYHALAGSGLLRGAEDARAFLPHVVAAHLLMGYGLTWLYRQIAPAGESSLARGLRFGAGVALAAALPGALLQLAMQPWPASLSYRQMLYGALVAVVLGMLLGYLHPQRTGVRSPH